MANLNGQRHAFLSRGGQKPVRVFGGVRNDADWLLEGVGFPESKVRPTGTGDRRKVASVTEDPLGIACGVPVFAYFATVDPTLSLVGDIVTLPNVLARIRNDGSQESDPTEGPAANHLMH